MDGIKGKLIGGVSAYYLVMTGAGLIHAKIPEPYGFYLFNVIGIIGLAWLLVIIIDGLN